MSEKIAVLGAGSWGTVLANLLTENGHDVTIWAYLQKDTDEINNKHTNEHYLPGLRLNEKLVANTDLAESVKDADLVLFVVPTNVVRGVAKQLLPILEKTDKKPVIVSAAKGLEVGTYDRVSQVIQSVIPAEQTNGVVVISGPSHAEDTSVKDITTLTAASTNLEAAQYVQHVFANSYFRLYTNQDVIGVEMGAALKNVIAIGAGALHGLGYGDNAKAALITRGLAEISRLGVKMGADPLTFIGLSGVGDLIVTATSRHSRNWRCGNQLGHGEKLQDVLDNMGQVVEGVSTAKVAHELAQKEGVEMPITDAIYAVLYEDKPIKQAITDLMQRESKPEFDY
ncbi:NAD(P)H-dependent glycerol-3-phosphate dehydrogenase [Lacticaseibacillus pabuli]|uniref:Glycerol-3-phosphate dehydrogenase [NAD(P)+] n=1 Tax=Lacticaseibacillus pabuli TaxID=3025672 RepID=A0ABY7WP55_9LACO|nr:NAD(P)H-dependent glycerol-3-phosphate dehydrogenase [Lacticaseibacillus sp. KACC 23028]WDF81977.1 NAD(P)H-dependent glycerol-3-phosphate dehydrogenase [Lacticaseibacillus sp. KACC 23028]